MHPNLKAALRIALMMAFLFLSGNLLMAETFSAAHAQAAQSRIQKPTPRATAPTDGVDTDPGSESGVQPGDQQLLEQMRAQLDREAMDRIRNGSGGDARGLYSFMEDFGGFLIFLAVIGSLLWILRSALEHRRWNRMVKVQVETHTKLLDKFGSSQEMLAYMDSEAGRRFLETPVFDAQNKRSIALPYGRILWSVQIGVIAAVLGMGLLSLRGKVNADADVGFLIFGTLVLILGVGFLLSGGVSYGLAKYLGLMRQDDGASARSSAHSSST
jgi:hypothetical protein